MQTTCILFSLSIFDKPVFNKGGSYRDGFPYTFLDMLYVSAPRYPPPPLNHVPVIVHGPQKRYHVYTTLIAVMVVHLFIIIKWMVGGYYTQWNRKPSVPHCITKFSFHLVLFPAGEGNTAVRRFQVQTSIQCSCVDINIPFRTLLIFN